MANIQNAIRVGVYSKLIPSGSNTFKTAISSRLYFHIALQGAALPYVVYDLLPINQDRDTVNKFYNFIVQFIVSSSAISECETVAGYLTDLLEDSESTLSFTGYSTIRIEREPQVNLGQIDNVWNIAVPYRVQLQKN